MLCGNQFLFSQKTRIKKVTFCDNIPAFNSIIAKGNVNIIYRQDNFYSVTFKTEKQILNEVFSSIKVDKFCLKIDASKLFENEILTVEIIAPHIDTIRLYDNASFYTPTNVWLKHLYLENYSKKKSTIYVNSKEFYFTCTGHSHILLSGIIDLLFIESKSDIKLNFEVISKYIHIKSYNNSKIIAEGKVFVCECHSYHYSTIDATNIICGRAKAFATEQSTINIKSEEKPILLSLGKGKINFLNNNAIIIDSIGIKNINKIND